MTREVNMASINLILKLRMLFGFYHNISKNIWQRYIIKLLLVTLAVHYIYMGTLCKGQKIEDVINVSRLVEYSVYFMCSIHTGEEYLINFYSIDPLIDDKNYSKNIRKKLIKILIYYIVVLTSFYYVIYLCFIYATKGACSANEFHYIYKSLIRYANEIGRIPIMIIFILLYFRVKIFCTKLRKEVLNNTTAIFDWKEHVKIYIKILDSLEKTDWPIKFMMLLNLITGFITITYMQFVLIGHYKNDEQEFGLYGANLLLQLLHKYAVTFFPSVMMELISQQLDGLKMDIADQIIACMSERRRSNLRELLNYFSEHPLKYCIYRAIHVCSRLPLAYLSLATTYLICLLQFTHVLNKDTV